MSRRAPVYYNVAPRYSGGSPAQVDFETATRVVDDELRGHAATMEGIYGEDARTQAAVSGLKGIVEEREERVDCWIVFDMLTHEKFIRMFPQDVEQVRERVRQGRHATKPGKLRAKYHLPVEEVQ